MKHGEILFCLQCRLSFTPLTRRARFCGTDCYDRFYQEKECQGERYREQLAKKRRARARAQQNEADAKLLTRKDIEERFGTIFDLEWAP